MQENEHVSLISLIGHHSSKIDTSPSYLITGALAAATAVGVIAGVTCCRSKQKIVSDNDNEDKNDQNDTSSPGQSGSESENPDYQAGNSSGETFYDPESSQKSNLETETFAIEKQLNEQNVLEDDKSQSPSPNLDKLESLGKEKLESLDTSESELDLPGRNNECCEEENVYGEAEYGQDSELMTYIPEDNFSAEYKTMKNDGKRLYDKKRQYAKERLNAKKRQYAEKHLKEGPPAKPMKRPVMKAWRIEIKKNKN